MRRYGLIGFPLGHSRSAVYFAEKFARERVADSAYDLFELDSIGRLPELLERVPELCGFNVTIPYKRQILPFLDDLSEEARRIGAVNCVRRTSGGQLVGYNTDAAGLSSSLERFLAGTAPERALVLGTGGASEAVRYVLRRMGIGCGRVSRTPREENGERCYGYGELTPRIMASHRLIVKASPVGMYPHSDQAPAIPYASLTAEHLLFDLIYNPGRTRFLELGAQQGARTCNGEEMFVRQAECSWEIWNGR
ncbi:MAG: shikimate dehydrogenase [Alistipes sp.]|nr:shikimate dehydrogenase [Alistipes sp.]